MPVKEKPRLNALALISTSNPLDCFSIPYGVAVVGDGDGEGDGEGDGVSDVGLGPSVAAPEVNVRVGVAVDGARVGVMVTWLTTTLILA